MNQYLDLHLRLFVNHFQDNCCILLPLMDFAQFALHHESTNTSPFELQFGHQPQISFDWRAPAKLRAAREILAQHEAKSMVRHTQNVLSWAKNNMAKAQQKKQSDVNIHRRQPDFDVGDKVWLNACNIPLDHASRKLGHQNVEPYLAKRKKGWSYELDLPENLKPVHPFFHTKQLRKDPSNPAPGQVPPSPEELQIIPGKREHAVELIKAVNLV